MLQLYENEKIIFVIHKHWFVAAKFVAIFMFLFLVPIIILFLMPYLSSVFDPALVEPWINMLLSLYVMTLLALLLLFWMDYYLDMWIITSERLIDVEQIGLFNREISEIPLHRVQDVTIQIRGIIETFLGFGTIRIQTAGEREFLIRDAPHLYKTKDLILQQIHARADSR